MSEMPIFQTIAYQGWPNCIRLANDKLEIIATTDVGPRIMRFGRAGGPNLFGALEADLGQMGGDEFRYFGGHRLQYGPEVVERIYPPENTPIRMEQNGDWLKLTKPVEPLTGIVRSIAVRLHDDHAELIHTLTNQGAWPVELAPWAVTVMAPGGLIVAPLPRVAPVDSLLPDRAIVLWPYSNLGDPRVRWGDRFMTLRHDQRVAHRIKFGLTASGGWLAYWREGNLFVKTFRPEAGAAYPDLGSAVEVFADGHMLELETLGPLVTLPPGGVARHEEQWHTFTTVDCDWSDDDAIERQVGPLIRRAQMAAERRT